MACQDNRVMLSLYVNSLLNEDETVYIETHLRTCKDCSEDLPIYRLIHSALPVQHRPAPDSFTKDVMQRIALVDLNITRYDGDSGEYSSTHYSRISVLSADDDSSSRVESKHTGFGNLLTLAPSESVVRAANIGIQPSNVVQFTPQQARRTALTYALRFSGVAAALVLFVGVWGVAAGLSTGGTAETTASSRNIFEVTRLATAVFSSPALAIGAIGLIAAVIACIGLYITRSNRNIAE